MIKEIYNIKDIKLKAFLSPVFVHSREQIERDMIMIVNDPDHPFSKSPQDYHLYYIGKYDDVSGIITTTDAPEHLFALDLVGEKDG